MDVKVSVVVPVSNPGLSNDDFGACLRSLLEQSLPPAEYEVIFADDGSTDGTLRRLDAIAARRQNVRVLHLDHTGSPARGRNVGLSIARGEFVYLLNQYDWLEATALERMYGMALETDADVLMGRLVDGGPPQPAFARDQARADVLGDHLLALPTAHKLFRRDFLEAQQLRFPDRPLGEQAFVTRAYLAAKVIAILAEQTCCRLGPAVPQLPAAEELYQGLNAIFDIVDAHTESGAERDQIYAYWYRTVALHRLGADALLAADVPERAALFSFLRLLTLERIPESVDAYLPVHLRAHAALLRQDRPEPLAELAEAAHRVRLDADLREVRWEGDVLELDLKVEPLQADGEPVWLREADGRLLWSPPASVEGLLSRETLDVTDVANQSQMEVFLRHAESGDSHTLPVHGTAGRAVQDGRVRVWVSGQVRLDPNRAAMGQPLPPGLWEVHVRLRGVYSGQTRLGRSDQAVNCAGVLTEDPRRLVTPSWSEQGEFAIRVAPESLAESITLVSSRTSVARQEGHAFVVVPVPYVPPSGGPPAELVLRDGNGRCVAVPALIEPGVPGRLAGQLVARVPVSRSGGEDCLGRGSWEPSLRIDQQETELRFGLVVSRRGQVSLRPAGAADTPSWWHRLAARVRRTGPRR